MILSETNLYVCSKSHPFQPPQEQQFSCLSSMPLISSLLPLYSHRYLTWVLHHIPILLLTASRMGLLVSHLSLQCNVIMLCFRWTVDLLEMWLTPCGNTFWFSSIRISSLLFSQQFFFSFTYLKCLLYANQWTRCCKGNVGTFGHMHKQHKAISPIMFWITFTI